MGFLQGTRRALIVRPRSYYQINDEFRDTRAAGTLNNTIATPRVIPHANTRVVADAGANLSIGAGALQVAGGTSTWGETALAYTPGIIRPSGYASGKVIEFDVAADTDKQMWVGLCTDTAPGNFTAADCEHGLLFNDDGKLDVITAGTTAKADAATLVNGTTYRVRFILYSAGCFYSISGGAFGTLGVTYTALHESIAQTTATLYAAISNYNAVTTVDNVSTPVAQSALSFADYVTGITATEATALRDLFRSTAGNAWTTKTGWLSVTAVATGTWTGITVAGGRVTGINLSPNNLVGTIPSTIGNLTALQQLLLNINQLSGPIPASIGNLTALTVLYLSTNQLSGPIPSTIGNLTALTVLLLYDNQLSGPIPAEIGNLTALINLLLYDNQLSGPIPSTIGNLTALTGLLLYDNQLSYSSDFVTPLVLIRFLFVQNNGWTQAESNAFVSDMFTSALTRTYASGIGVQMHGTNAAPSGVYQSPTVCPPTSPKEQVNDMVNNYCATGINAHIWTMN